jgi:hypothetical protein
LKKVKQPGDNISLKTKKNENPLVMSWLNSQSNLMDSIRYLVECEISSNGVRNLQTCIPAERGELQEHSRPDRPESADLGISADVGGATALSESAASEEVAAAAGQLAAASASETKSAIMAEEEVDDEDVEAWS